MSLGEFGFFFFFQAEDGIRDWSVTGVQTCALPIYTSVVSVDSITLVNPKMRVRKILNYRRPAEGEPLTQIALAGFGIEQKK